MKVFGMGEEGRAFVVGCVQGRDQIWGGGLKQRFKYLVYRALGYPPTLIPNSSRYIHRIHTQRLSPHRRGCRLPTILYFTRESSNGLKRHHNNSIIILHVPTIRTRESSFA